MSDIVRTVIGVERYIITGTVLITIASALLAISILVLFVPLIQWTVIFAIGAMIVGTYAFKNYEAAAPFKPLTTVKHRLDWPEVGWLA